MSTIFFNNTDCLICNSFDIPNIRDKPFDIKGAGIFFCKKIVELKIKILSMKFKKVCYSFRKTLQQISIEIKGILIQFVTFNHIFLFRGIAS